MEDEYFRIMRNEVPTREGYAEHDLTSPACVYRGAQWLDTFRPHWPRLITQPIELLTFDRCVLGQVFAEEVVEGGEGYLYARIRYEHEWQAVMPWWMRPPDSTGVNMTPAMYLGYKGGLGAELAWQKEMAMRKATLLQKELGL